MMVDVEGTVLRTRDTRMCWRHMRADSTIDNRSRPANKECANERSDAPTAMTESRERHNYARLQGRWIVLARGIWIALVVLTLAIFFASLPVYLAQLQTPSAGTASAFSKQLTPEQAGALKGIGLSPGVYAAYTLALTLASVVVCLVVSTLIAWRRPDDRM